jgi:hypothetical protein
MGQAALALGWTEPSISNGFSCASQANTLSSNLPKGLGTRGEQMGPVVEFTGSHAIPAADVSVSGDLYPARRTPAPSRGFLLRFDSDLLRSYQCERP